MKTILPPWFVRRPFVEAFVETVIRPHFADRAADVKFFSRVPSNSRVELTVALSELDDDHAATLNMLGRIRNKFSSETTDEINQAEGALKDLQDAYGEHDPERFLAPGNSRPPSSSGSTQL